MNTFTISEAFHASLDLYKKHWKVFILIFLLSMIVEIPRFLFSKILSDNGIFQLIIAIVFLFIGLLFTIGTIKAYLKATAGHAPSISDLYSHKRYFWKYIGVAILFALMIGVSLLPLLIVIPVVFFGLLFGGGVHGWLLLMICLITLICFILAWYVAIRYGFAAMAVLDTDMPVMESFHLSARLTKGVKWKLVGLVLFEVLVVLVGALLLGVGILVAIPVATLMHVWVYRKLISANLPVPTVPVQG